MRTQLAIALLLAGTTTACAGGPAVALCRLQTSGYVCKHCHCMMPSDAPPESMCSVCHCKKTAQQCRAGT